MLFWKIKINIRIRGSNTGIQVANKVESKMGFMADAIPKKLSDTEFYLH